MASATPVGTSYLRRRASTAGSTGLDYSSSHWVDDDIKTRIRSLLLSRNSRCPPRTPFSSDEHGHHYTETCTTISAFDFGTAKSVASSARKESRHLSLAGIRRALTNSAKSDMEILRVTQAGIPSMCFATPRPRHSASAEDLKATIDGPTSPAPTRKRFGFPKLVLQDKKQQDNEMISCIEFSPSIPENDVKIHEEELDCCPPCDPRDSKPSKYIVNHPSQAGPAIKVAPGDLACFLAGCPPSQSNCAKHQQGQTSTTGSRQSVSHATNALLQDAAKLGYVLKSGPTQVEPKSGPAVYASKIGSESLDLPQPEPTPKSKILPLNGLRTPPLLSESSSITSGSFDAFPHAVQSLELALKEDAPPTLSTTINTNFSLPGVRSKQRGPPTETSNAQNSLVPLDNVTEIDESPFQLDSDPLVNSAFDNVEKSVRNKLSDTSFRSKKNSPSLLSGASKKSARHALLKPCISEEQPVDTGLPIPPVISIVTGISRSIIQLGADELKDEVVQLEKSCFDGNNSDLKHGGGRQTPEKGSTIVRISKVSDTDHSWKDSDNVSGVSGIDHPAAPARDSMVEAVGLNETDTISPLAQFESSRSQFNSCQGHELSNCESPFRVGLPPSSPPATQKAHITPASNVLIPKDGLSLESETSTQSRNATYWGFVPDIKEAVQDAVQKAVQIAVQDITIPPGTKKDRASKECRRVIADSLATAAKNADDYLLQSSLWNKTPYSRRESEVTILVQGMPTKDDIDGKEDPCRLSKDASPIPSPPRQGSVCFKDQENSPKLINDAMENGSNERQYGDMNSMPVNFDSKQNLILSPTNVIPTELETISLDQKEKFNERQIWKRWKKGPPSGYSAIPSRQSSRSRVLSPKPAMVNSSTTVPVKDKLTKKRSFELAKPHGKNLLCSISSVGSLQGATALLPMQMEKSLVHNNTVHWLKDLLSSNGPYEPRFTALPPRTRKGQDSQNRVRSNTAPVKPVANLFLGVTTEQLQVPTKAIVPTTSKLNRVKRMEISETFTRTINDLEALMSEAITIARQAADSQDPTYIPSVFGEATKVLKSGRKDEPLRSKEHLVRGAFGFGLLDTRGSDDLSSVASIHESLKDYSDSDSSYQSDPSEIQHRAISLSLKEKPRNPSGWPPTGRVLTPYPPASLPTSNKISNEDFSIKPVDPRSMPLESSIESPKDKLGLPGIRPAPTVIKKVVDPGRVPTFRNIEPFQRVPTGEKRKSSGKSPRHLSVVEKDQVISGNPYNSLPEPAGIKFDLCGEPIGHSLPKPDRGTSTVRNCTKGHSEDEHQVISAKLTGKSVPNRREVRDYIIETHRPLIPPRESSKNLRKQAAQQAQEAERDKIFSQRTGITRETGHTYSWQDLDYAKFELFQQIKIEDDPKARFSQSHPESGGTHSLDGSMMTHSEELDFNHAFGVRHRGGGESKVKSRGAVELQDNPDPNLPVTGKVPKIDRKHFSLSGKRHVSLKEHHLKGFSLSKTHKQQKIARDWSSGRKRFVASVACFSTALIGIVAGIYAGETPAIQYYIVDFHHYTVLGNVFFFIGLSIPTFLFWPLPLLHGRKPYILGSMSLAMPLLFPQALAVGSFRSPYVSTYRVGLLMSRALMGFCLGFANMNFKGMLTDLFGASLQSTHPHQEHVDEFDVRRHGGGMGIWLGLWTWSALGSIGLGFLIGACIINTLPPAWGFYVSIIIIAFVMLLNILCPEVRRSAFRRSVAEVVKDNAVSRRLARGEVKMHMVQSGPKWWGEEFHYGVMLSQKMLRQPGFMIMAVYVAWIYGQQVLIIVVSNPLISTCTILTTQLLGALMSKDYNFKSPMVGLSVMAIPLGALVAIPFQKAGLFSRSREHAPVSDDSTFKKKIQLSSHMIRRTIFVLCLPIAGLCYTFSSGGPPTPFLLPILFAGWVGFLSNLAMAECHGIIMETFDTSDLQPGMTGRPRGSSGDKTASKRTNYSSFPRVMSAFAITQGIGYLFAACASGVGGVLTRHLGQQAATGVMAGILLILSILLLLTLVRFTEVQIIPDSRKDEMDRYHNARRASQMRREDGMDEEEPWRPIIIGNPHHSTRRMCLLELGSLSRFSEIRIKNRLVDEAHLNRMAINTLESVIKEKEEEIVANIRRSLSRHSSKGSRRSRYSDRDIPEQGDLGGHREMLRSGNGSKGRGRSGTPSGSRKERRITE